MTEKLVSHMYKLLLRLFSIYIWIRFNNFFIQILDSLNPLRFHIKCFIPHIYQHRPKFINSCRNFIHVSNVSLLAEKAIIVHGAERFLFFYFLKQSFVFFKKINRDGNVLAVGVGFDLVVVVVLGDHGFHLNCYLCQILSYELLNFFGESFLILGID